jgi:DNA-binding LacI/PurR family transcriptional regulator
MRALAERERRVPAEVAIVGFDDIPFAGLTTPPLSTVRQDCRAGARLLVDGLLQQLRGEAMEPVVIPATLVVRESSLRERYRALPSIGPATRTPGTSAASRKARSG